MPDSTFTRFAAFIEAVSRLRSISSLTVTPEPHAVSDDSLDHFIAFLAAASLLPRSATTQPRPARVDRTNLDDSDLTANFAAFIEQATPIVVARIREVLPRLRQRLRLAQRWIVKDDLLSVAGYGFVENAYTRLMAWALDPATHRDSAKDRQRAWLETLGLEDISIGEGVSPETQLRLAIGIPDLVFQFHDHVVIVEAKTGTREHNVPSGVVQSTAYLDAPEFKWAAKRSLVFITPDKTEASDVRAKNTTYIEFAISLAKTLENVELPRDVENAFRLLISHLLVHSTDAGDAVLTIFHRLSLFISNDASNSDRHILDCRKELLEAMKLFRMERSIWSRISNSAMVQDSMPKTAI